MMYAFKIVARSRWPPAARREILKLSGQREPRRRPTKLSNNFNPTLNSLPPTMSPRHTLTLVPAPCPDAPCARAAREVAPPLTQRRAQPPPARRRLPTRRRRRAAPYPRRRRAAGDGQLVAGAQPHGPAHAPHAVRRRAAQAGVHAPAATAACVKPLGRGVRILERGRARDGAPRRPSHTGAAHVAVSTVPHRVRPSYVPRHSAPAPPLSPRRRRRRHPRRRPRRRRPRGPRRCRRCRARRPRWAPGAPPVGRTATTCPSAAPPAARRRRGRRRTRPCARRRSRCTWPR